MDRAKVLPKFIKGYFTYRKYIPNWFFIDYWARLLYLLQVNNKKPHQPTSMQKQVEIENKVIVHFHFRRSNRQF